MSHEAMGLFHTIHPSIRPSIFRIADIDKYGQLRAMILDCGSRSLWDPTQALGEHAQPKQKGSSKNQTRNLPAVRRQR